MKYRNAILTGAMGMGLGVASLGLLQSAPLQAACYAKQQTETPGGQESTVSCQIAGCETDNGLEDCSIVVEMEIMCDPTGDGCTW
jgi:hypothetical protein